MPPQMPLVRLSRPTVANHGAQFYALRFDAAMFGAEGTPWFTLDHFRMAGPTFPPHPHAGFSAVTYVLPRSQSGMRNQDSQGDRTLIDPGGLHWTAAGRGIIHEEIPAQPGAICEGFQMFVRQPGEQELANPVIHHRDADQVPVWSPEPGIALRLLAGAYGERDAGFAPPTPLALIDVALDPGAAWSMTYRAGWGFTIYLYDGDMTVNGQACTAPVLIALPRDALDTVTLVATSAANALVMTGEPIDGPLFTHGPFALSSPAALDRAIARYRSGELGHLAAMT